MSLFLWATPLIFLTSCVSGPIFKQFKYGDFGSVNEPSRRNDNDKMISISGNICYLNSVLQVLSYTRDFR